MAEGLCEAQVTRQVEDEHGKPLPPEIEPCKYPAKAVVTREFSGITQALCGVHAKRVQKPGPWKLMEVGEQR